jgi:thiamine kinase-like enzyme
MRDVGSSMIAIETIPIELHLQFLDHMAELHARFWDFRDTIGLFPNGNRYFLLSPLMATVEAERGGTDLVPTIVTDGWERTFDASPLIAKHVRPLLDAPYPLAEAQANGPQTLVHGDWKAGNLGAAAGRTVLIDWAVPSRAPATIDIADYLAINCDLLPTSKEDTIAAYRDALHRHGIDTDGWWERSLELSLLGLTVFLAWSKDGDELAWWEDHVERAVRYFD